MKKDLVPDSKLSEGFSFVPIGLVFLVSALVFWGAVYVVDNAGDFRGDVYSQAYVPPREDAPAVAVAFNPLKRGKRLYSKNCQACHQASGRGVAGAFPPLLKSPWVVGDKERFAKIVLHGLSGPIEVLGGKYNGNMPSYGDSGLKWSNRDVAAVLSWVRQAWGNGGDGVAEDLVKAVREATASQKRPWKVEDLLKDHPLER